jgi:hypothetical protein
MTTFVSEESGQKKMAKMEKSYQSKSVPVSASDLLGEKLTAFEVLTAPNNQSVSQQKLDGTLDIQMEIPRC